MKDQQLLRYARHILLPQVDVDGQQQLLNSHVMIIGLGGLGSPVAQYLAASGVGRLSLVDPDQVELSNLQRQLVHSDKTIGQNKVDSARQALQGINPDVALQTFAVAADEAWLLEHLQQVDVVVDCSDNAGVRYAINRACLARQTPWVSGAAVAMNGQLVVFDPRQADSPCYRCLYAQLPDQPGQCADSGILAPVVGTIGSLQAVETLKVLLSLPTPVGSLLTYDALSSDWRRWQLQRQPDCEDCGQ
jgi:adenylyltransferase/sulfurtransferase